MTADLVAFIRARLDEDEQAARACPPIDEWWATSGDESSPGAGMAQEFVEHFDPARVLAEVAAKHALLDIHTPVPTERALAEGRPYRSCSTCDPYPPMDAPNPGSCPTLRLLVRPYAEHPHFHPSWATE